MTGLLKIRQFLCLCIMGMLTSAYAAQVNTIHAFPNSDIRITLPANPTTGYQWQVQAYDHSLLQMASQHYYRSTTRLMGAGGQTIFIFKLKNTSSHPKSTEIVFKYSRPWEPSSGTIRKVKVLFD